MKALDNAGQKAQRSGQFVPRGEGKIACPGIHRAEDWTEKGAMERIRPPQLITVSAFKLMRFGHSVTPSKRMFPLKRLASLVTVTCGLG